MPSLYILAGPNGSGKTTFYENAKSDNFISPDLPFLNVDLLTKDLGGYTEDNYSKADIIYRQRISQYISEGANFMIESNLAKSADYDWIEKMKHASYQIILYFISTSSIEENIARVKRRVKEGGHDIPDHIIIDRYRMGLIYLKTKLSMFKEIYFLDNTETTIKQMAHMVDGKIDMEMPNNPEWVNSVLFFAKRLQQH